MNQNLKKFIKDLETISLEEINSFALMKRTDTKFVIHEDDLIKVLKNVHQKYRVLEIKESKIMT